MGPVAENRVTKINHAKSNVSTMLANCCSVSKAGSHRVCVGGSNFLVANLNLQDSVCGLTLVGLSGRFLILPLKFI